MPMCHHAFGTSACARVTARVLSWFAFVVVLGWCRPGHAQWITQTNQLRAGWNSVYLHVDVSHTNANSVLLANPNIEEAWMWTADLHASSMFGLASNTLLA